jgi:hypothetical protein
VVVEHSRADGEEDQVSQLTPGRLTARLTPREAGRGPLWIWLTRRSEKVVHRRGHDSSITTRTTRPSGLAQSVGL